MTTPPSARDLAMTAADRAAHELHERAEKRRLELVEQRSERAFVQRAEAIGLRYNVALRIEGYNISRGKPVSIAIYRSEGTE